MGIFDRSERTVLGSPLGGASGGGGGGILWSTPVDSSITPDSNNAYDLGTSALTFKTSYFHSSQWLGSAPYFYMEDLAGGGLTWANFYVGNIIQNLGFQSPFYTAFEFGSTDRGTILFSGGGGALELATSNNYDGVNVGSLYLTVRDNATLGGNTGDISLKLGAAGSGGVQGEFKFLKVGSPSVIGQVWTATGVNGEGYWAAPSGGGANTSLSNLTSPTSINQDLTFQSNKNLINLNQIRIRKTVSDYGAPIEVGTGAVNVGAFLAAKTTGAGSSYVYMTNGTQVCGFGQDGTGFQGLIPGGFVFGNLGGNTQDVAAMQNGTFRFRITSTYVGVESVPFRFPSFASAPGTPGLGDSYYDTTTNKVYTWDGSVWQAHF